MNQKRVSNFVSLGLVAMSIGFAVSACSMKQDPFADKSEEIRNGVPPEADRPGPVPKPRRSDALRIDTTTDFYTFKEQVESEFTISGRVLDANPQFELSIDNLKDFPGAKFDPKTGSFKWMPPRETTGTDYGVPKRLQVRLTAFPTFAGGAKEGTTRDILIYVTRAEIDPEIVSVEDLVRPNPTREGELRKFIVTVRDPDGIDADGGRPVVSSVPAKRGSGDISSLVYMEDTISTDPNPMFDPTTKLWKFKMLLDLRVPMDQRGRDFTRTQEVFKFGLKVTSRFDRVGMRSVDAAILTDVLKPEVSWFDPIEIVAGQENVVQFTAYDPYAEAKVSVNFITRVDQLPGSAVSVCKPSSREGNILCRISWKPSPTTKGDFGIDFKVLNESKVFGDRKFVEETFRRIIRVIPGPPPPATPSPSPTPFPSPTPSPSPGKP